MRNCQVWHCVCRRKRSGSTPVEQARRRHAIRRSWTRLPGMTRTATAKHMRLVRSTRMPGGCTICWGMCMNGVMTVMRDYSESVVVDPVGPTDAGAHRVIRGGSWGSPAQFVRAANRDWDAPASASASLASAVRVQDKPVSCEPRGSAGMRSGARSETQPTACWALTRGEPDEDAIFYDFDC